MRIARMHMAIMILIGLTGPLLAQAPTAATERAIHKIMSRRAAEADAYRKLAECIKGLRINPQTYVKDFMAESDVIESSLDDFVRHVRLGPPLWNEDLSCEVVAEVPVTRVIATIRDIHTRYYYGDRVTARDLDEMGGTIPNRVIKVMGMGAPRPDLPPALPTGVETALTPLPMSPPPATLPPCWQAIPARERLMAIQAAERDCQRRLLERVKGLRISSDTLVRDFVTESDVIQATAAGLLQGYQRKQVYLHDGELIVEVTGCVPVELVVTMIKDVHRRSIQGSRIRGRDIDEATRSIKRQWFEATGVGVPRPSVLKQYAVKTTAPATPEWANTTIRIEGRGVAPADMLGTAQGRLLSARAAELDARRKLADQILSLHIDANTTVRDFISRYEEVRAHVDAFMVSAAVESTEFEGDWAMVTVSLPGLRVWSVLSDRLR